MPALGAVKTDGRLFVISGSGSQGGAPELSTTELLAASDVLASATTNLVQNGGFDEGLDGWGTTGSVVLSESFGIEAPGAKIEAGSIRRTAPATGSLPYAARALYRRSGTGTATLRVEYLNGSGTVTGQAQASLGAATNLTSAEVLFTPPPGTASVRMTALGTGAAELVIDDITLARR